MTRELVGELRIKTRLSLVIFGATGFTGKFTVKEAARLSKIYPFTWGIAGRRKEALENVLQEFQLTSENIPIILADLKDEKSIANMTEKAEVIVNCCGPYRFYGETVIKSCIATKTHHVDVSGEPQFMERMQLEYDEAARKAGVYVISACGFDSIPCDLGIIFAQKHFEGEVNAVETYLSSWNSSNAKGAKLHYGTWESAVYGLAHANELRPLRSKLYPNKLPQFEPKLPSRGVHQSALLGAWSAPFPGADRSVAMRSQRFLFEKYKTRPAQVQCYITFKSFFYLVMTGIVAGIFGLLTKFEFGRKMLLQHPKFFSLGMASHEGPTVESMENTHFCITVKATGWAEKLSESTDKHANPPNKEMIVKVVGVNPGYGATCTALLVSALTILKEKKNMPDQGGVLPPGAAFAKTSMIKMLHDQGLTFDVIS